MTPPTCCYRHRAGFDASRPCADLTRRDLAALLESARALRAEAEEAGDAERALIAEGVSALAEQLLAVLGLLQPVQEVARARQESYCDGLYDGAHLERALFLAAMSTIAGEP